MRQLVIILFSVFLWMPCIALAKRGPAPNVKPVIYKGVRYIAGNHEVDAGHVQAWDVKTDKLLWDLTIYHNFIIPFLEEDVQWVLIKNLSVDDGKLIVIDERDRRYSVDLETRSVKPYTMEMSSVNRRTINPDMIFYAMLTLILGLLCTFRPDWMRIPKNKQKKSFAKSPGFALIVIGVTLLIFQILRASR